jgi:hypothetical protein
LLKYGLEWKKRRFFGVKFRKSLLLKFKSFYKENRFYFRQTYWKNTNLI